MSPVFRHGRLRLYLLRLLEEEPRHGYEVIRLLRDQFMGVYAPSPGTIYPRLARLEEEGLVTHDEIDGRKVYRITEAGRTELRNRGDELDEIEEELSASVSDIVREVKQDVRETVRSLREELTFAAREMRRTERQAREDTQDTAARARDQAREQARAAREQAREQARRVRENAWSQARERGRQARDEARDRAQQLRDQAASLRGEAKDQFWDAAREHLGGDHGAPGGEGGRGGRPGWGDWPGWSDWARWTDWPGRKSWPGPHNVTAFRDLERLAREFAGDLRKVAWDSGAVGGDVLANLRGIFEETLDRIRDELFGSGHDRGQEESQPAGSAEPRAEQAGDEAAAPPPGDRPRAED